MEKILLEDFLENMDEYMDDVSSSDEGIEVVMDSGNNIVIVPYQVYQDLLDALDVIE